MTISSNAVTAAGQALRDAIGRGEGDFDKQALAALEAAAPHVLAEAWERGYHTGGAEFEADNPYRTEA